jgi:3-keto-disaccharide hydrolase
MEEFMLFVVVCIPLLANSVLAAQPSWRPLFNGKDLTGWETYMNKPHQSWDVPGLQRDTNGVYLEAVGKNRDPLKVFTVETVDGRPAIHISGQGFGVMTTTETFDNFHLRLQVKWGEKRWGSRANSVRDSGLLYFVHGEPGFRSGAWPRSIEFQIQEHDMGDLYAIGTQISVLARKEQNGTNRASYFYDPKGERTLFVEKPPIGNRCIKLGDPEKPRGEWNTLELICVNGDSIHVVNGKVVMRLHNAQRLDASEPAPLNSGALSLQTEGAEVFYRDVEIRPIKEVPPEFAER